MSRLNVPSLSVVTVTENGARFIGNCVIVTFWSAAAGVIWPVRPMVPPKKIVLWSWLRVTVGAAAVAAVAAASAPVKASARISFFMPANPQLLPASEYDKGVPAEPRPKRAAYQVFTIRKLYSVVELDEQLAAGNPVSLVHVDGANNGLVRRHDRRLHLHRFEYE